MVSEPRPHRDGELGDAHLGDARGDIEIEPDRRMAQPDLHVDRHQDAEMHRMDAEADRHRKQDRRGDQHDRGRLHHVAGDQQQDIHEQQELDPGQTRRRHPLCHLLRDLLARHQEREQHRVGDDVEDHGAHAGRPQQHARHVLHRHVLVNEHRDDEGIDRAHRSGLGRRECARVDAAEHDDDQQQAPYRLAERGEALAPARLRHARIVVLPGAIPRRDAEHRGEHQPRDHAGHEQLPDRSRKHALALGIDRDAAAGRHRIDHHDDRRRDEDAERARGRDDAGAEPLGEALRHHRRQDDRADRHDRRRRRARDRREQRAGQHAG